MLQNIIGTKTKATSQNTNTLCWVITRNQVVKVWYCMGWLILDADEIVLQFDWVHAKKQYANCSKKSRYFMQVITMIKKNKRKYAKITHYNTLLKNKMVIY